MLYRPLLLLTLPISIACAQEIIKLDKIEVEEHVIVLEERKENAISKRIITGDELNQYGDMNALEMLKRTPGVTVPQGKIKKGSPGKGYTKILVDGEEVYSSKRGNPLEQISPDMIERIEVMTNGSAEFSAESMGGIVNIILKKPASEGKTLLKFSVGSYQGEPMTTLFAQREGKRGKLSYLINTTVSDNAQNEKTSTSIDKISTYQEKLNNDYSRNRSIALNTKLIYTPTTKDKYMFDGALNLGDNRKETDQNQRTDGAASGRMHQYDDGQATMLWAKFSGNHNLSGSESVEWKLKFHQNRSTGETRTDTSGSVTEQTDEGTFRVLGSEGSYSRAFGEHFLKTGAEFKHLDQDDNVRIRTNGVTTLSDHQQLQENKGSVYLQDEIAFGEKTVVTPGVRYENVSRDYGALSTIDYLAPSLHLLHHLSARDNIRLSVAKTVKLPRLSELSTSYDSSLDQNDLNHPDTIGNPNLKEESALSYECRYEHFFEDKGIVSIGGFYRTISDKIEKLTQYDTGSGRYVERPENSGRGTLRSIDIEFKKSLETYVSGLGVFANATVQNSSLVNNGVKRTIKGTNDYLYTAGIDHNTKRYQMTYGAAYRYVGGYDDPLDENGVAEAQRGYGTLDVYAMKRINSTFKAGINLKNITASTISTTSKRYQNGVLTETQTDRENSRFHFLLTLEGRW